MQIILIIICVVALFYCNRLSKIIMNMSRDRIYEQLTSEYGEMFTAEEAQYAIDNMK